MVTSVFATQSCEIKPFESQGPVWGWGSLFPENTLVPTDRAGTAESKPPPPPGLINSSFTNSV